MRVTMGYNRSFRITGAAVVTVCMLVIACSTIGVAATKEEVAHCRAIEKRSERLDCFKSLNRSPKSPSSDEPITPASTDRLSFAHDQPLCQDRDAVAAMILAGLLSADPTKAATPGCQTIPDDAKLELVERSPSFFTFMRIIKVKVTSQKQPDLKSGFTIEIGH